MALFESPGLPAGSPPEAGIKGLRRQWGQAAFVSATCLAAGFVPIWLAWPPAAARRWLAMAGAACALLLGLLCRGLRRNRRPGDPALSAGLGAANWITLARGLLICLMAGFLGNGPAEAGVRGWAAWGPSALYSGAVLLDAADGWVARRINRVTELGAWLDTQVDALGLLAACLLAVRGELLPAFYIAAGAVYYVFWFGVWLRRLSGRPVRALRPSRRARVLAGVQMAFLSVSLAPVVPYQAAGIAAAVLLAPFLAGFAADWRSVCGAGRTR